MEDRQNIFIIKEKVLQENFEKYSRLGNICYPMKTNSTLPVLTILKEQIECGENYFSISNLKHFTKLYNLGVKPNKIILINTIATNDIVKTLYDNNVRFFTFDNLTALSNFSKYADIKKCKLFFRLSVNEEFHLHSHIGANSEEIKQMIKFIEKYNIDYGISFYLPKEINNKNNSLKRMLKFIEKKFSKDNIKFLTIAGIKKTTSIKEKLIKNIKQSLQLKTVFLEPGEYMLYGAIDLKTSIVRFKYGKRKSLILKNGIFSGMLDRVLYNKKFDFILTINGKTIHLSPHIKFGMTKIYVYGGSGDSVDYLGKYYIEKEFANLFKENQEVIIKNAGAYFEEFYIPHGDELQIVYDIIK